MTSLEFQRKLEAWAYIVSPDADADVDVCETCGGDDDTGAGFCVACLEEELQY